MGVTATIGLVIFVLMVLGFLGFLVWLHMQ